MTRSIFNLDITDLEQILISNQLPDDVTLEGIETRKDFEKLFKHRTTPKFIAQTLLKEKVSTVVCAEPNAMREQRLKVKQLELELRQKKAETQSHQQEILSRRMLSIEQSQGLLISGVTNINNQLAEIIAKLGELLERK